MSHELLDLILARRSCKSFTDRTVAQDDIAAVIEAGLSASSGMNLQSPIVLCVTDRAVRDRLMVLNRKYDFRDRPDPFYRAPVILAVLADKKVGTYVYDGSLVIVHMLLAAQSLGLGACWIHRAKEVFQDEEGQAILHEAGIEGDYEGIGFCVLGYPETLPEHPVPPHPDRVFRL